MLQRFDAAGIQCERLAREAEASGDVAGRVPVAGTGDQLERLAIGGAQCSPSTRSTVSSSVKTRNEFVRTFPCALTASETRVIASSSGASAMIT